MIDTVPTTLIDDELCQVTMFLYLLKFKTGDMMKVGIAKNNSRIENHERTYSDYGIDLDGSVLVRAKNDKDIKMLEGQLLQDYIDYSIEDEKLLTRDGATEIRSSIAFKLMIEDIKYKAMRFPKKEYQIETFSDAWYQTILRKRT